MLLFGFWAVAFCSMLVSHLIECFYSDRANDSQSVSYVESVGSLTLERCALCDGFCVEEHRLVSI